MKEHAACPDAAICRQRERGKSGGACQSVSGSPAQPSGFEVLEARICMISEQLLSTGEVLATAEMVTFGGAGDSEHERAVEQLFLPISCWCITGPQTAS